MYRAAKFASAISAGVVASVPFTTVPISMLEAAEECLSKPTQATPPGQHWYYLIERGSKRRCWYLHKENGTSSHAAISRRARRAAILASRESEPAVTRTPRDAHAEFGLPRGHDETAPEVSHQTLIASDYPKGPGLDQPNNVSGENAPPVVASRWPEPAGVPAAAVEPPPSSFVVASATPDARLDAGTADLRPKVPPVALTSADTPATGMSASLEPLFMATIGAITLTGFAGSSVYLLARMRRRPETHASLSREPEWPPAESVDYSRPPLWLYRAHDEKSRHWTD
jgi:hypothetical protein